MMLSQIIPSMTVIYIFHSLKKKKNHKMKIICNDMFIMYISKPFMVRAVE